MADRRHPDELLSFPCCYEFKAFGLAVDDAFAETVRQAVCRVVPVGEEALRTRASSNGTYQCVTVLVHLENSAQLTGIYAMLRDVDGLRYLL